MLDAKKPVLVLSDLQLPFEASKALEFCSYIKRHYGIPNQNVLCVGDEVDIWGGSMFAKDPNAQLSIKGEIAVVRQKVREWRAEFPHMKVCISNHGLRWVKKATAAEIPAEVIRSYHEIFDLPDTWVYKDEWRFTQSDLRMPFRMIHGLGYSGKDGHRNAALDSGISTVHGHLHSHAGIDHIRTLHGFKIWGFNVGCLIDVESYAFQYEKNNRFKPCLGIGVIFQRGTMPVWIPYED